MKEYCIKRDNQLSWEATIVAESLYDAAEIFITKKQVSEQDIIHIMENVIWGQKQSTRIKVTDIRSKNYTTKPQPKFHSYKTSERINHYSDQQRTISVKNNMFRILPFFCPGYALIWNNIAAQITFHNISEEKKFVIGTRQLISAMEDGVNLKSLKGNELVIAGGYYMAMSLAGEGIPPILPNNQKKWYPIKNINTSLYILGTTMEAKLNQALNDFKYIHGIDFEDFIESTEAC